MKRFIFVSILSILMALGGSSLYAHNWGHHGQGYHHDYGMGYSHMGYLHDELNLTDEQVEKIIKINAEYRIKFYQNRDNYDKIINLRQKHRKAVYNVLTDEQKKRFDTTFRDRRGLGYCRNW